MATPDGACLVYGPDRANVGSKLDLFRMELHTGENVQRTASAQGTNPQWADLSADSREVFYISARRKCTWVEL